MKILQLNLLAFGPFSGQSLNFDQAKCSLHIVYGPNEAGKSSSLRALRQCLYGIPHNCTDNFIHSNPNLRIGAVLQDAQGKQLEIIRRKGRDKTLRASDDVQPVDASELATMLGGIDESSFCQRFGIGYEELRDGGRAIVEGGGELGTILFAAGAGIADVRQVQSRIEAELQELFKSGGSNPRINKTLAELKAARDQIKELLLPTAKWVEEDKALKAAKKRQGETDHALLDKKARKARLERFLKALPLIANSKHCTAQLAAVKDVPLLPEDFTADRRAAEVSLGNAKQAEQEASTEISRLKKAIAELKVPQELLDRRSAISHLHSGLGSYQKAAKDRPGLVAEKRQMDQRATEILQELGRVPDLAQANGVRLTKVQRQRIQELATECKSRFDTHKSAEAAGRKLATDIKAVEAVLASLPRMQSCDGLKRAIRQAQKHGDLDQQLSAAQQAFRQLETNALVELKQLQLFTGTLDELEQLPVCSSETIDRFEIDFADTLSNEKAINDRIAELTRKIQSLDSQLEALRLAHDVPTEIDLSEARRQRGEGWQLIRNALTDGATPSVQATAQFIGMFAAGRELPQAFQISIEKADAVADRLRHEAERVAEKATLTADRSERAEQLACEHENRERVRRHLADLQSKWMEHWNSLNAAPLPPREMRPWLRRQQQLIDKARAIRIAASVMAEKSELIASLKSTISGQLGELGQAPTGSNAYLSDLIARSESLISATEVENRKRVDAEQKLVDFKQKLVATEEEVTQAATELQNWSSDWSEAVAVIGLTENASTSEAIAVVQSVDELFAQLKESSSLVHRIAGIDQDAQTFKVEVQSLLAAVASDLLPLSVELAVSDLSDRLSTATSAKAKVDEWNEQLVEEESKLDKAHMANKRWKDELNAMCATAKCHSIEQLPEIERQSALRRTMEQSLNSATEQLVVLTVGESLDGFINDAEAVPLNEMQAEAFQLANDIEELERVKNSVAEAIGGHQTELKRMDGNGRAAESQAEVEHLLAVVRGDVDQYVRLRLAATVLRRSIERFRQNSQGPVIDRAGAIFTTLTLGAFSGLRADYDEKGKAALVGVRASNGQSVGVEGMSDGTCDQLYLALRLALLESFIRDHDPIPFIVDDILIQFDDDRATASLKALAELSQKTQVIFFTHHEHLVELARRHVDADVQFTHRLDSSMSA